MIALIKRKRHLYVKQSPFSFLIYFLFIFILLFPSMDRYCNCYCYCYCYCYRYMVVVHMHHTKRPWFSFYFKYLDFINKVGQHHFINHMNDRTRTGHNIMEDNNGFDIILAVTTTLLHNEIFTFLTVWCRTFGT